MNNLKEGLLIHILEGCERHIYAEQSQAKINLEKMFENVCIFFFYFIKLWPLNSYDRIIFRFSN